MSGRSAAAVGASDVAAALGPGSMLQLLHGVKQQAPSFMPKTSSSSMPSMAGCVTGSVIRHGPDGRGSTAAFLASTNGVIKRAPGISVRALGSIKKLKTTAAATKQGTSKTSAQAGITAYLKGRQ
eukprot:gene6315-6550_t